MLCYNRELFLLYFMVDVFIKFNLREREKNTQNKYIYILKTNKNHSINIGLLCKRIKK